jgi:membrane protease YdiL (CAAX protease family)
MTTTGENWVTVDSQLHRRLFPWAFYSAAALFAAVHLTGLKSQPGYYALAAMMLASHRLWSGAVFGYARIRYGLLCSIGAHSVHNLIVVVLDTFID